MVMCEFIDLYLSDHPLDNILVLSHVKEILEQNFDALEEHFEGINIGLYSAGMQSRSQGKITVAGIQSVYRKPEDFQKYGIVIIDECHLVSHRQTGMYRAFLDEITANYVGLTATHFRTGHGYIHIGDETLFNKLVYNMCDIDGFDELITNKFLSPLYSKGTAVKLNTNGLKVRAHDYVPKEMSERFDRASITGRAVSEIIDFGAGYNKWLVFAIDIDHAEHVTQAFKDKGIPTGLVHSKMEGDRQVEINRFKLGKYKCMVNVDILTTGFDAPDIDLIAMLRPTQSPILHIQSLGRGMRISDGKDHCLVLDFAGNVSRLGPINDVQISQRGPRDSIGAPRMKECPDCQGLLHLAAKNCSYCGYVYPVREKITDRAYQGDIIRSKTGTETAEPDEKLWYDVEGVRYTKHKKIDKPDSVRVTYKCGLKFFNEYICIEHEGFAGHQARNWVRFRSRGLEPTTTDNLLILAHSDGIKQPSKIQVKKQGKYHRITDVRF